VCWRRGINISGVDFWHAVEFSRNGRFLCACFTRLSGRFPSVLRFRLYQILSVLIFAGAVRPFGFSAVPTLPDPLGVSGPLLERGLPSAFAFRLFRLYQIRFAPFPVRIRFRLPVGEVCLGPLTFVCGALAWSLL
jgi:hypothetical protein